MATGYYESFAMEVYASPALDPEGSGEVLFAIWDTGATHTSISRHAANLLGLKPTGRVVLQLANQTREANTYKVNLILRIKVQIQNGRCLK